MLYEAVVKSTLLYFSLHIAYTECHLKDMGKVSKNWTKVLHYIEKRIIGGSDASSKEFPFSVQFLNLGGLCGGTILTKKIVLTAAHCFDSNKNLAEMKIFSNTRYIFDLHGKSHEIWHFEIHKDYGRHMVFSSDIAIVLIHDEFEFGSGVQKTLITNTEVWMKDKEIFSVNGWGETKYGEGIKVNNLKKTTLYFVNREECMKINKEMLGPDMFCLHGDGERDTCRGDSGGGVIWKGALVGVVSHGRQCAQTPGVYINVYYFRSWINSTVHEMYKKYCDFHNFKLI